MEIKLGAEAIGTDGALGHVRQFIIDPKSQRAEQLTVRPTLGKERVVSLLRVTRAEEDKIYLDLDKRAFEGMELFNDQAYRVPGQSEIQLPNWINEGATRDDRDPRAGVGQVPFDLRTGPEPSNQASGEFTPADEQEPVISKDTAVLDANGDKIGPVDEFAVDNVTGQATRLSVRYGHLRGHAVDVPLDWVREFAPEGVMLKVGKEEVERSK